MQIVADASAFLAVVILNEFDRTGLLIKSSGGK